MAPVTRAYRALACCALLCACTGSIGGPTPVRDTASSSAGMAGGLAGASGQGSDPSAGSGASGAGPIVARPPPFEPAAGMLRRLTRAQLRNAVLDVFGEEIDVSELDANNASLIYVTSDTAWGKTHGKVEWSVILAGKAAGRLRGDEHHNFPGDNLGKVLLTIAQVMGGSLAEIGIDAGRVTSPLSGIQV